MLNSTYLFLTCVKNNAIGIIEREFLDGSGWYLFNCHKIHPAAVYLCLLFGHVNLLRLLLHHVPNFNFTKQIEHMTYAIDVALAKGKYDVVGEFMNYLNHPQSHNAVEPQI